jgi:hypothetical protein
MCFSALLSSNTQMLYTAHCRVPCTLRGSLIARLLFSLSSWAKHQCLVNRVGPFRKCIALNLGFAFGEVVGSGPLVLACFMNKHSDPKGNTVAGLVKLKAHVINDWMQSSTGAPVRPSKKPHRVESIALLRSRNLRI